MNLYSSNAFLKHLLLVVNLARPIETVFDIPSGFVYLQIAISNPNREVLLTLSRSGVVEMIGKEWYFVRVHDAVQVCLQYVQGLKETPQTADPAIGERPNVIQRLLKQRSEDSSIVQLESGYLGSSVSEDSNPQLEPLLSRKI